MNRLVSSLALLSFVGTTAFAQSQPKPPAPVATPTTAKPIVAADDPWASRKDLFVAPPTKNVTKVDLGAQQRFSLGNGLQVIAVPRHQAPVIDVTLAFRVDDASEPIGKAGLAQFTASMLRKGTQKRTADQLSNEIDSAGGEFDASSGDTGSFVACRARSRSLPLCLDLVSDVTQNPTFPDAELGEIRDQLNAGVDGARDNPSQLARLHAANFYFGDDDQRGLSPSKKSIQSIDRQALLDFYKAWYVPNNAVLVISGDFDEKSLKDTLNKTFGAWKQGTVPKRAERALPPVAPLKVRLVDKPDATQSQIVIVGPGIKHADADLFATRLMNYTLGGGLFSSRLMKVVRSEGGKTYGASSRFETHRDPGTFMSTTFTRGSETANTIKLVLAEIDRMRTGGPTADELGAAKSNMIGGYGLQFETGDDVARQLLVAEMDGLPADFVTKVPQKLDAVTLANAIAAAKAHLAPQALVVVGNAAEVAPLLTAAVLKPTETIAYTDPVSGTERKAMAAAKKAATETTPAETAAGQAMLDAAIKAHGGDVYLKLTDLHVNGGGSMTAGGQNMHVGFEGFYQPSRGQREDLTLQGMTMSQVFVDGKAFIKQDLNAKDLQEPMVTAARRSFWRDPALILIHAKQPGVKLRALAPFVDGKKKYDAMMVVSPQGDATRLLFDQSSHQLVGLTFDEDGKQASLWLSDFKSDGGMTFPRHIVSDSDGEHLELSYDKVKVNKGLPKDTFEH